MQTKRGGGQVVGDLVARDLPATLNSSSSPGFLPASSNNHIVTPLFLSTVLHNLPNSAVIPFVYLVRRDIPYFCILPYTTHSPGVASAHAVPQTTILRRANDYLTVSASSTAGGPQHANLLSCLPKFEKIAQRGGGRRRTHPEMTDPTEKRGTNPPLIASHLQETRLPLALPYHLSTPREDPPCLD